MRRSVTRGIAAMAAAMIFACLALALGGTPGDEALPSGGETNQQPIMLRMAESLPENHPSAKSAALFAQLVEERSGGRIRIKVYYGARLGSPEEVLEQMQFGGIALAGLSALDLTELNISLRKMFAPEAYEDEEEQTQWIGNHREELSDICAPYHIIPLVWYDPDFRCFYSNKAEVAGARSLNGSRVQTESVKMMEDILSGWGAEAVGHTSLEPYKFLNAEDIDCAESAFGEFLCGDYADYCRYVTLNRDIFFPDVLVINREYLEALGTEDRNLVKVCAEATYEYQRVQMKQLYDQWEEKLRVDPDILLREGDFR